ncbi:5-(carboxyamino)imidazole ribonucleotide synthase [Thorsellia anophelis]|uniref:N5-carboxyaminoimidazole ribonucleotide synthase n=1 Tax=Thorsellia anophelis DSM 18579 TaxID=1123402 RepID=A0A1I0AIL7_9GAMM|nr:5-(carboxyamino)imidazole ribonucleotide synthase [Thorsellia anophelis]SES93529.1 5-(carboxyamino)imidazole ribonucleotide synthase [Thorsellia anophelis DSM 18579]
MSNSSRNYKKQVFVLGNGQLARMLKQAAEPLGISVSAIGLESELTLDELKALMTDSSVITAEIERWPHTPITQYLSEQPHFVNHPIFAKLADRYSQKSLIDELKLETAPWVLLPNKSNWSALFNTLGDKLVVKTRTGGYDGRGQWRVTKDTIFETLPEELTEQAIVESMIPFNYEISIVGARSCDGNTVFYPITHNYHQDGILRASVAFSNQNSAPKNHLILQEKAESMLSKLLHALNYVGVMAMECFVIESADGPTLLINELAPRVHNSGHWTQNGASISQFELHIRAICNLPLPSPVAESTSVMINIIGTPIDYRWIENEYAHLHWYDKDPRPGRKLGHINYNSLSPEKLKCSLTELMKVTPIEYSESIGWAISLIK